MKNIFAVLFVASSTAAFAQTADVRLKGIQAGSGDEETAIVIRKGKGKVDPTCVKYQILDENEEIWGENFNDRAKALASYKLACEEWTKKVRDLNKGNQLLAINCGKPVLKKDDASAFLMSFGSTAKFKIKVKVGENES